MAGHIFLCLCDVCVWVCLCVYICMCMCVVCMCMCVVNMCVGVWVCGCMSVCVYVCVYVVDMCVILVCSVASNSDINVRDILRLMTVMQVTCVQMLSGPHIPLTHTCPTMPCLPVAVVQEHACDLLIYLLRTVSICFCWNFPLIINCIHRTTAAVNK